MNCGTTTYRSNTSRFRGFQPNACLICCCADAQMVVSSRSNAAIHRFVRSRRCKGRGFPANPSSRMTGASAARAGPSFRTARLPHDAARHRLARRNAPGLPGRGALAHRQALARPAGRARRGRGARHRAAAPTAGVAGAGARRPRRRHRRGARLPRSDHPQADARSVHRDGDGSRRRSGSPMPPRRARRSRSSATTTSTARPRRRCSPGICAIAGSIR